MKITIVGHKGQLGAALEKALAGHAVQGLDLPEVDITRFPACMARAASIAAGCRGEPAVKGSPPDRARSRGGTRGAPRARGRDGMEARTGFLASRWGPVVAGAGRYFSPSIVTPLGSASGLRTLSTTRRFAA